MDIDHPEKTGYNFCDCEDLMCTQMPAEEAAKHELVTCPLADGGCGEEYRLCDTEEAAKHELGTEWCQPCKKTLHKCVENNKDGDIYKAHHEALDPKEECEYCKVKMDYLCQKWVYHYPVECDSCHEIYGKCVEYKHHCTVPQ
ncbi:MAG: hypothetical protein MJ063_06150 [Lachnospiraceae bacterium]|nr:hypothetical protein [Lachnospiraceae bacterium]